MRGNGRIWKTGRLRRVTSAGYRLLASALVIGSLLLPRPAAAINHLMVIDEVLASWQGDPEITDEAHGQIFEHTGGLPRRINTLCSRLLLFEFLEERHVVEPETVRNVARDLAGELPVAPAPVALSPHAADGSRAMLVPGELSDRVATLERKFQTHDRVIKHAISIATEHLERMKA